MSSLSSWQLSPEHDDPQRSPIQTSPGSSFCHFRSKTPHPERCCFHHRALLNWPVDQLHQGVHVGTVSKMQRALLHPEVTTMTTVAKLWVLDNSWYAQSIEIEASCLIHNTPLTANAHSLLAVAQGSRDPKVRIFTTFQRTLRLPYWTICYSTST